MREPARAALDDVSEQLGEVLRRADRLLAEWSAFGTRVREQVDREAMGIGAAVASSVDAAVRGAADAAIETRLSALTAELGRLEQRIRAASRALDGERTTSRRIGWIAVAGIALANGLLALLLLREPVGAAPPPAVADTPAVQPAITSDAATEAAIDAGIDAPTDAAPVPVDAAPVPAPPPPAKRGTLPPRRK